MIIDETRILTNEGFKSPSEIRETQSYLFLCPISGIWQEGAVGEHGLGEFWTYSLSPLNNPNARLWHLQLTRPHLFSLVDGTHTHDLRVGDVLPANGLDAGYSDTGWGSGFMYRRGVNHFDSLDLDKYPLYRQKLAAMSRTDLLPSNPSLPKANDPVAVKASFIKGYLAADGYSGRLDTPDKAMFDFFVENHGLAGIVLTGGERCYRKKLTTKSGVSFYNLFQITYCKGVDFKGFRIKTITGPSVSHVNCYSVNLGPGGSYVMEGGWIGLAD